MPFVYVQRTGALYGPNGSLWARGYSGRYHGWNNPEAQTEDTVGPCPTGRYTIISNNRETLALYLKPAEENEMHGRGGLFIRGNAGRTDHNSSDGCLIFPFIVRQDVRDEPDGQLIVVAEETDRVMVYG